MLLVAVFTVCLDIELHGVHCVATTVYHPTVDDNFNSCSCPIPVIFGTVITE